jgi:hypothetical protein
MDDASETTPKAGVSKIPQDFSDFEVNEIKGF